MLLASVVRASSQLARSDDLQPVCCLIGLHLYRSYHLLDVRNKELRQVPFYHLEGKWNFLLSPLECHLWHRHAAMCSHPILGGLYNQLHRQLGGLH